VTRVARLLVAPAILLGITLLLLAAADLLVPMRNDVLGLSRVFAPYVAVLFIPLGVLALLVRGRRGMALGAIAFVGLGLAIVRFVPGLPQGARAVDADLPRVDVTTWNLYLDAVDPTTLIPALAQRAPAIVSLQELTPERAQVIADSDELRELFPYQVLEPTDWWDGMGLLSSWPFTSEVRHAVRPPFIAATIDPPNAAELDVIAAHAPPPQLGFGPVQPRYDPWRRDAALHQLRAMIDERIDAGRHVVLLGDLNLTDREIAYAELSDGLTDSYYAAGTGLGHTWRPGRTGLPFGLLRIDMVLTGPGATPVASEPDCAARGTDHCILDVTLAVAPVVDG
jgi:endonuclease/exonuclease/phosphatase family metal-dependent hydrolase